MGEGERVREGEVDGRKRESEGGRSRWEKEREGEGGRKEREVSLTMKVNELLQTREELLHLLCRYHRLSGHGYLVHLVWHKKTHIGH